MDLSTRIAPAYREKRLKSATRFLKCWNVERWISACGLRRKRAQTLSLSIRQFLKITTFNWIQSATNWVSLVPEPGDWLQVLLRMPDVMSKTEIQELSEEEWNTVHATVLEAVGHLVDFRKQEGAALEKKFREKIENINSLLEKITPYEKERVEKVKERITDALEKTLNVDYDKNRLEQELIYYIEKLDVNEEKQRLGNHLKYFISTMESGNGQGKKLGFIAQEMGREINTLGSKSNHAEMQKIVVQMKDELEQIKEQVLNVM